MGVKNCKEMMCGLFSRALDAACDVSGLEMGMLLGSKCEMAVTARVAIVDVLVGMGMAEGWLAEVSGWSQQRVNRLKNAARWRLKGLAGKMMREEIGRMVDNLYLCGSE